MPQKVCHQRSALTLRWARVPNGRHDQNLTAVRLIPGNRVVAEVVVSAGALFFAVFVACAVEAVEATTIVLAAGTARGWLLVFGLQWLRKAILRASGHKPLHDEDAIYQAQMSAAKSEPARRAGLVPDLYGFTLAFKGVLLEGLEVVFIALTFGGNAHQIPLAALAAISAVVVVASAGLALKTPLATVPENTMKFAVGVMLTAFGTFWGAEGAGVRWPGSDAALLAIVPAIAVFALALVASLRKVPAAAQAAPAVVEVH